MARYVLVHGAWHGAWCWHKVLPRLRETGHDATAVDLPGHGRKWRAPAEIQLGDYTEAVLQALDSADEPAVLVGHSFGGVTISQAAEARPERIHELVYLAAFLLQPGEAAGSTLRDHDPESLIVANLTIDEEQGCSNVAPEAFRDAFYHDCSEDDVELAGALLTPEPLAPPATPVEVSAEGFGRVRKTYVETLQDRGVTLSVQRRMHSRTPCDRVLELDTSHSPFLSRPDELAELLAAL